MKLKALVETVRHHLERDGRPPLTVDDSVEPPQLVPVDKPDETNPNGTPDKIVVFSNFPSSNNAIGDVKFAHNFPCHTIDLIPLLDF